MFDQSPTLATNGLYPVPHHNLPQPLTTFVGREAEKQVIQRLLTSTRLLTLIGAGGSGKTRLALEIARLILAEQPPLTNAPLPSNPTAKSQNHLAAAHERLKFPDGIWWVELAPVADPLLVSQAVLSAMNLHEQPARKSLEFLTTVFAPKTALLVLDNCEHMAAACATLVAALLPVCPHLRILTTSREPLGVEGETLWLTPPLASDEAVGLFIERAEAVWPDFNVSTPNWGLVVQVCQQVEGLPLAIELAAARLKVLSVEQIAARLADTLSLLASDSRTLPARQRTMSATLDWSYALLTAKEQRFFPRLAVFAGSFNLDAVEAVCAGQEIDPCEVLDLLAQLANKSLMVVEVGNEAARYRLLEPVRQYAVAKLQARGEEVHWRTCHLAWCVALAEQSERELNKRGQVSWLQRLEQELANLRAAFDWSRNDDACRLPALRLAVALNPFWQKQSRRSEGRRWLAQFNTAHETLPIALQAKAFFCSARLAYNQLDLAAAVAEYRASIDLCFKAQLARQQAQAWEGIGLTYLMLEQQEDAAAALQESLAIAEANNVPDELMMALRGLGLTAQSRQDYAAARTYYTTALVCARTNANDFRAGHLLEHLGYLCLVQGDYATARSYYLELLALAQQAGITDRTLEALIGLATVAYQAGNSPQAQQLYHESLVLLRAVHKPQRIVTVLNRLAALAQRQGAVQEAQAYYTQALALRDGVRNTDLIATLAGLGDLALMAGAQIQARDHYSEALALALTLGGSAPANFEPAMPMILSPKLSSQSWVSCIQEKLRQLFVLSIPDSVGLVSPLEDLLNPSYHADFAAVTASPAALPIQASVAAPPTDGDTLQIYAFGPLRVYRGGHQLGAADWGYRHAQAVLLYLLLHPSATRGELALEFWPDASPEQVRSRFSAVLTHTRKALGRDFDWIPFEDGRYRFDRRGAYWFDVEAFEAKLRTAHKHLRRTPRQVVEAIACLESAIALYQGDLGADLKEGEWYQGKQEQLRQALADALLTLGRLHVEAAHYDQAADVYRRALAHDRYLEEAYRELMRCLARQGEAALALRQYAALVRILQELGVPPALESQTLAERLRRGEQI